jgi:capsular polysaccharide biosynthesis protein
MKKIKSLLRPYWLFFKELVRSLKILLIKPIQSLPISSEILGPPKGFYESTQKWVAKNKFHINEAQGTYTEIYPPQSICRSEPGTLDENVHWKFKIEYQFELPASFVAVLPRGRVWVNKGPIVHRSAVITADDRLLSDLSVDFRRLPNNHSIFAEWKLPPVHNVEGIAAVLTSAKSNIYFHWMTDILPRIELLHRSEIALNSIDKFIINSYNSAFQQETLTALGIPSDKIIQSCQYPHVKAETLLVPSLPGISGNPPLWVCDFLKKEFMPMALAEQTLLPSLPLGYPSEKKLAKEVVEKLNKVERIYISRSRASYRKVINEAEVTDFLEELGFQNVILESMTVSEQILVFSSAKVVVAPHGAGLTNTVFCQPKTKVIEIFSPKYVNVCYWSLANQTGLDYYYLLGVGQNPPEGIDPHLEGEDILVELTSLSKILKLAGVL